MREEDEEGGKGGRESRSQRQAGSRGVVGGGTGGTDVPPTHHPPPPPQPPPTNPTELTNNHPSIQPSIHPPTHPSIQHTTAIAHSRCVSLEFFSVVFRGPFLSSPLGPCFEEALPPKRPRSKVGKSVGYGIRSPTARGASGTSRGGGRPTPSSSPPPAPSPQFATSCVSHSSSHDGRSRRWIGEVYTRNPIPCRPRRDSVSCGKTAPRAHRKSKFAGAQPVASLTSPLPTRAVVHRCPAGNNTNLTRPCPVTPHIAWSAQRRGQKLFRVRVPTASHAGHACASYGTLAPRLNPQ